MNFRFKNYFSDKYFVIYTLLLTLFPSLFRVVYETGKDVGAALYRAFF